MPLDWRKVEAELIDLIREQLDDVEILDDNGHKLFYSADLSGNSLISRLTARGLDLTALAQALTLRLEPPK